MTSSHHLTGLPRLADKEQTPAQDGQSKGILISEEAVRRRIARQRFASIRGGYQIDTIFLSEDLTIYHPRVRDPLYLQAETADRLRQHLILGPLYRWVVRMDSPLMHTVKQMVKVGYQLARGNFSVLDPVAQERTLKGYRLAERLGDLVDPFLILEDVDLRLKPRGEVTLLTAIVRERSDRFLIDELRELVAGGQLEKAEARIEEALRLYERMWEKGIFNRDLHFFENMRIRDGRVVLRDAGDLTDDFTAAVASLGLLYSDTLDPREHPIEKSAQQLSTFSPNSLVNFYRVEAGHVFSLENFRRRWPTAQDGQAKEISAVVRWFITALAFGFFFTFPSLSFSGILAFYKTLQETYPWQANITIGAFLVGLSDWFGQWMAHRGKGVPILKKQIGFATAWGAFSGGVLTLFYPLINPFPFLVRVGLSVFMGFVKGVIYSVVVSTMKRDLPAEFRSHYNTLHQTEKFVTIFSLEIPIGILKHLFIQSYVPLPDQPAATFVSNGIYALLGGWALNRFDTPLARYAHWLIRRLEPVWRVLEKLGWDIRGQKETAMPFGTTAVPQSDPDPKNDTARDGDGKTAQTAESVTSWIPRLLRESAERHVLQEEVVQQISDFAASHFDKPSGIIPILETIRPLNPYEETILLNAILFLGEWQHIKGLDFQRLIQKKRIGFFVTNVWSGKRIWIDSGRLRHVLYAHRDRDVTEDISTIFFSREIPLSRVFILIRDTLLFGRPLYPLPEEGEMVVWYVQDPLKSDTGIRRMLAIAQRRSDPSGELYDLMTSFPTSGRGAFRVRRGGIVRKGSFSPGPTIQNRIDKRTIYLGSKGMTQILRDRLVVQGPLQSFKPGTAAELIELAIYHTALDGQPIGFKEIGGKVRFIYRNDHLPLELVNAGIPALEILVSERGNVKDAYLPPLQASDSEDETSQDGGHRLQRYQSPIFEDLHLPHAVPVPAMQKPIEVGSGV